MQDHITQRLSELKADFETGQTRLAALDREATQVRETLLRISGAIQVLEEVLAGPAGPGARPLAAG